MGEIQQPERGAIVRVGTNLLTGKSSPLATRGLGMIKGGPTKNKIRVLMSDGDSGLFRAMNLLVQRAVGSHTEVIVVAFYDDEDLLEYASSHDVDLCVMALCAIYFLNGPATYSRKERTLQFIHQLKQVTQSPIIAVSWAEDKADVIHAGITHFASVPLSPREFKISVQECLSIRAGYTP